MKQQHVLTGFPAARLFSVAILLSALSWPATTTWGQDLHEIMAGSVGRIEEDVFECGRQRGEDTPCGLSYRYYCVDVPEEVNSPAAPNGGFASYRPKKRPYMAAGADGFGLGSSLFRPDFSAAEVSRHARSYVSAYRSLTG